MLDFAGRVALVTGAGQGIGRAHAIALGERGCRVVVNGSRGSNSPDSEGNGLGAQVALEITRAGGVATSIDGDIANSSETLIGAALDTFGRLDIVINNAGSFDPRQFDQISEKDWQDQLEINLIGTVKVCRAAWPHLTASGSGAIVNTLSGAIAGNPLFTSYSAIKAGLLGFSQSLAQEGRERKIRVNSILPNAFTRQQSGMPRQLLPVLEKNFRPEYVAAFATWLVHQDTDVSGEMFQVGGGVATRITFAHFPPVRVAVQTPEAWASLRGAAVSSGVITPFNRATYLLEHDLRTVDPKHDFTLSSIMNE